MAQAGDLGDDLHAPVPAVPDQLPDGVLGKEAAAAVFKVDGVLGPAEHSLDLPGPFRVASHFLAVFQPAFVDLRVAEVLHGPAHLDDDGIAAVVEEEIHGTVKLLQGVGSGKIDFEAPEGALGNVENHAAGNFAAVVIGLLEKGVCAVQLAPEVGAADGENVPFAENGIGILGFQLSGGHAQRGQKLPLLRGIGRGEAQAFPAAVPGRNLLNHLPEDRVFNGTVRGEEFSFGRTAEIVHGGHHGHWKISFQGSWGYHNASRFREKTAGFSLRKIGKFFRKILRKSRKSGLFYKKQGSPGEGLPCFGGQGIIQCPWLLRHR